AWEAKSVNGNSVEARLRLPPGTERRERAIRQAVQRRFARGNFQLSLTLAQDKSSEPQPVVNEAFLKDLAGLARRLVEQFGAAPASADGLLALRGVLDPPEAFETEEMREARGEAILAVLEKTLSGLEAARRAEGAALGG